MAVSVSTSRDVSGSMATFARFAMQLTGQRFSHVVTVPYAPPAPVPLISSALGIVDEGGDLDEDKATLRQVAAFLLAGGEHDYAEALQEIAARL